MTTKISKHVIANNAIETPMIAPYAVGTDQLANKAIITEKIALGAVSLAHLATEKNKAGKLLAYDKNGVPVAVPYPSPSRKLLDQRLLNNHSRVEFNSSLITPDYGRYEILFEDVKLSDDDALLFLRVSTDGGVTWKSQEKDYRYWVDQSNDVFYGRGSAVYLNYVNDGYELGNQAHEVINGRIEVFHPANKGYTAFQHHWIATRADAPERLDPIFGCGQYNAAVLVNALALFATKETGPDGPKTTFSRGTLKLYGVVS